MSVPMATEKQKGGHILTQSNKSKEKQHKCPQCDYVCIQAGSLKKHMLSHSEEKLFGCKECSNKCKERTILKRHAHSQLSEALQMSPMQLQMRKSNEAHADSQWRETIWVRQMQLQVCKRQLPKGTPTSPSRGEVQQFDSSHEKSRCGSSTTRIHDLC